MSVTIDPVENLDQLLSSEAILDTLKQLDEATLKPMIFTVMRQALSQENVRLARQLAALGVKLYPDDAELKTAVRVLAPPKVIATNRPANPQSVANAEWLRNNSMNYQGQWIALKKGEFLGTAASRKQLVEQLVGIDLSDVFIVRMV